MGHTLKIELFGLVYSYISNVYYNTDDFCDDLSFRPTRTSVYDSL